MGRLPGKNVSDEEFAELKLRGQLTEVEDLALFSSYEDESHGSEPNTATQLERAANIARELAVVGELDDEAGLANELTGQLEKVRNQRVSDASLQDVLKAVVRHIPEDWRGDQAQYG